MDSFGQTLRKLREEKRLPLRIVAAYLDIDQAILSKIERGQRNANREMVIKLAKFFRINENDLLLSWLSDKLVYEVADEDLAQKALQLAEVKVGYLTCGKLNRNEILRKLKNTLKEFKQIQKAYIYGSFSREDDRPTSDIDIALETDPEFSYFDLAEVQHVLEIVTKKKVDLGFIDSFKPYIKEHIEADLKLIYER